MMFSPLKLLRSVLRTLPSVCVRACVSAYVCAYLCHHLCVRACMSACMYVAALLFWFVCSVVFVYMIIQYSSTTTVLYIKDHGDLGFPIQKNHPKTSFTTPSWHLGSIGQGITKPKSAISTILKASNKLL